ncbi:MAG: hypothetical protein Q9211_004774 [Gyalolechia sp. 1 TL-2023]
MAMPSSNRARAVRASILFLVCLRRPALAATGQGSVSLWSDSSCGDDGTFAFSEPRIIDLNRTLPADTCHNLARSAHSYSVTERPMCNDGREADFSYYGSRDCPQEETRSLPASLDGLSPSGLCLALVTFDSVAFVCAGVGSGESNSDSKSGSTTQFSPIVTSRSDVVLGPTPTLSTPSSGPTAPLYTVLDTSGYTLAPTETAAPSSGQPSPTGMLPPPPFTDSISNSGSTTQLSPIVTSRSDLILAPTPTLSIITSRSDLVLGPTPTLSTPSSGPTAPLYTVLDTSGYTLAPTETVGPSSGQPSPTGVLPPSPSPLPGAAAGRGVSLLGVIFGLVAVGVFS